MKFFSVVGIIAVVCASSVYADNASKVKVTKAKLDKLNSEYFNPSSYKLEIVEVNAKTRRIQAQFEIVKDFPLDTQIEVKVLQSPSGCGGYKEIGQYSVSVCNNSNDKYAQYLPDDLIELKKEAKCLTKGLRKIENAQPFKFYNLLTEEQLKNSCFKTITSFTSGTTNLYTAELEFVSN